MISFLDYDYFRDFHTQIVNYLGALITYLFWEFLDSWIIPFASIVHVQKSTTEDQGIEPSTRRYVTVQKTTLPRVSPLVQLRHSF